MPLKCLTNTTLSRLPFCAVCNKSVDGISLKNNSSLKLVSFRVFCHGEEEGFHITYDCLEYETLDLSLRVVFKPKQEEKIAEGRQSELIFNKINTVRKVYI